jgi:hypothetical protein
VNPVEEIGQKTKKSQGRRLELMKKRIKEEVQGRSSQMMDASVVEMIMSYLRNR